LAAADFKDFPQLKSAPACTSLPRLPWNRFAWTHYFEYILNIHVVFSLIIRLSITWHGPVKPLIAKVFILIVTKCMIRGIPSQDFGISWNIVEFQFEVLESPPLVHQALKFTASQVFWTQSSPGAGLRVTEKHHVSPTWSSGQGIKWRVQQSHHVSSRIIMSHISHACGSKFKA
jgi:hypothetical protein